MLSNEIRLTLRRLLQAPGFSLAAVLMLGLGVALSCTMFAVIQGVLGSLPFPQSERLVVVESRQPSQGIEQGRLTPAEARELEQSNAVFNGFGYYVWGGLTIYPEQRPQELNLVMISEGLLPTLGMAPQLGRGFDATAFEQSQAVAIISHQTWQQTFGGRADVIGQFLESSEGRLQVIGVMPEQFAFPSSTVDIWRALPRSGWRSDQPWFWNARFVNAIARLGDAPADALQTPLQALAAGLAERYGLGADHAELRTRALLSTIVGELRYPLWGVFAIAALVLLIACANVAILIDARQLARRHEQALQQALGASRGLVLRAALLEIVLLSTLATLLGIGLCLLGIEPLRDLAAASLPRAEAIALDGQVLAFAAALAIGLPLLTGVLGALRAPGAAFEVIRGSGPGSLGATQRRRWLPLLGVSLSTVSVIAGGALLMSLWKLQSVDPGFHNAQVYALRLFYRDASTEHQRAFIERTRATLAALPGVQTVAVSSSAPMAVMNGFNIDLKQPQQDRPEPYRVGLRRIDGDYLRLLGIGLHSGRAFDASDRSGGEKVAMINRTLAKRLYGERSALDQQLELPLGTSERVSYRIVGVVEDMLNNGLRAATEPELLIPLQALPAPGMTFLIRSAQPLDDPERLFSDALYQVDPQQALSRVFSLQDEVESELASARFFARSVGGFALTALLLAAFGTYAVANLRQRQRAAEFGLRLAIGAAPMTLLRQMLGESSRSTLAGIALGAIGGGLVLRLLQAQLFGLEQADAAVWLPGLGLILLASLAAALLPAWRAAHTDPIRALRHD